ncbi:MAG: hypothetical protein R2748_31120 [Bryobacterales bacterium]
MRNIVILVLIIVALAIVRSLVSDVSRAVSKAMKSDKPKEEPKQAKQGRFVRDPQTGAYVDEESAVHAEIDGKAYCFESTESRDAFLRSRARG